MSIDSDKIVEILFDNSEQLSNDIYVDLMALMKRYHDYEDNHDSISSYLDSKKDLIDPRVFVRIKRYITPEPYIRIAITKQGCCITFGFLFFISFFATMMYSFYIGYRY
jgi:hypothetical protein